MLGRHDRTGGLRYLGRTTTLVRAPSASFAEVLVPAVGGHPWEGRTFTAGWGSRDVLDVVLVDPQLVVEVAVDVARDRAGLGATLCASTVLASTFPGRRAVVRRLTALLAQAAPSGVVLGQSGCEVLAV
ncbi:hypothetical protein STENM327S_05927 [Streptomyces tendae]